MISRASLISCFPRMSAAILGLVLALGAALPASAQQNVTAPVVPSHLAVAVDVLKASGLMTMFDNAMPNVVGNLRANLSRQRPELIKDIEESLAAVEGQMGAVKDDGISVVARALASKMSESDLKEVKTFLTSPAGKKYVETLPAFMEEVVPFLEQWVGMANERMTKTFQDEMTKRGHKL